ALNCVIMYRLFMPVTISQLHVIGYRISKPEALIRIFFRQSLPDHELKVFAEMRMFGITFWIVKRLRFWLQRFPRWNGVGRLHIQFEIRNKKKMIPEHMPEIFHIF